MEHSCVERLDLRAGVAAAAYPCAAEGLVDFTSYLCFQPV